MTSNDNNIFDISKDMDNCINNLPDIKNNPPDIVINNRDAVYLYKSSFRFTAVI